MLKEQLFNTGVVTLNCAVGPKTGPPLVLLHGGSSRWQSFASVIPNLAERWQLYALDFRGHGKSGWTPGHYRLQDYAADTVTFLQQQLTEPALLFGHSLGAEVALLVAAEHPETVRAIVYGDAPLSLANLQNHTAHQRSMTLLWRELAGSGRPVAEIAAVLQEMLIPVPKQETSIRAADIFGDDHPWFQFMAESLSSHDPTMLTAILDEFEATFAVYSSEVLLPQITCPVLLLQADPEHGGLLTDLEVEQALALLPQATHVRFKQLGHALHMQQPETVLPTLIDFLESVSHNHRMINSR